MDEEIRLNREAFALFPRDMQKESTGRLIKYELGTSGYEQYKQDVDINYCTCPANLIYAETIGKVNLKGPVTCGNNKCYMHIENSEIVSTNCTYTFSLMKTTNKDRKINQKSKKTRKNNKI